MDKTDGARTTWRSVLRALGAWVKRRSLGLRLGVTALIIFLILRRIDLGQTLKEIPRPNFLWVLAYAGAFTLVLVIRALRWQMLIRLFGGTYPFVQAFPAVFRGAVLAQITPARTGDFVRAEYAARHTALTRSQSLSTLAIEKIIDVLVLCLLALVGAGLMTFLIDERFGSVCFVIIGVAVVLAALFFLIRTRREKGSETPSVENAARLLGGVRAGAAAFADAFSHLRSHYAAVFLTFLIGGFMWFVIISQAYFASLAVGFDEHFWHFLLFFPVVAMSTAIPITIAGLGIREGVMMYLFWTVGISNEKVAAYALFCYVCRYSYLGMGYGILELSDLLRRRAPPSPG